MLYNFITNKRQDTDDLKITMERTANLLSNNQTTLEHPGILLGMIQSGKTRAFIGILAKCFDDGYDVAIVLTKSSKALVAQTVRRIRSEFLEPVENDYLSVYDIMELPPQLTPFILRKKLVFVVKKEDDNLRRLNELFFSDYRDLANKRVLIIDDEADFASVSYAADRSSPDGIKFGVLASMISEFRNNLTEQSDFLQVTATPYSLYLQPKEIEVGDGIYAPLRPRFTEILNPHSSYTGGHFYFEESLDESSPASNLYIPVPESEFQRLRRPHTRYLDTILETPNLRAFRSGLLNFIVGASIRLIQETNNIDENDSPWRRVYKCSYLIHTEQRTAAHEWQSLLTTTLIERLEELIKHNNREFKNLIEDSYNNISLSVSKTSFNLPSLEDVIERSTQVIIDGEISVREVNSVARVINQLDENGQLRLDNPLNIFIGGQVLDRGITIDNLIGFFYGRDPRTFQMDTVLQHSRMYGARSKKDLAVTRIYTSPRIHLAMERMYYFDRSLRESIIEQGEDATIRFIERDSSGGIRPCSPSKIKISQIRALRGHSRILPVGFQTESATRLQQIIPQIDSILNNLPSFENDSLLATMDQAGEIIDLISDTFVYRALYNNEGWDWNANGFKEIMQFATTFSRQDQVLILTRENRNINRLKNNETAFTDAPDDGRTDLAPARLLAQRNPVLILIKQNGATDRGWRGHNFYWPILITPAITQTSIYSEN